MDLTANHRLATAARVVTGVGVALAAAAHGLFWLFISAWQCDESCDYPDAHGHYPADASWQAVPGAWQWSALGWLGAVGFLVAVGFAVAFAARRRRLAPVLAVATAAAAIAPWVFLSAA
jgi:hypothetical protein